MELKPSYLQLKNFKFQSGEILEELKMEYFTMGKAKMDEKGNINNGLLFLHGWSGDYSSFKRYIDFTEPGQPFDKDKYFIISTTALGSPGSAAPSTSSLGKDFPQYTVDDMVNAQYQLLKELKVDHLKGIIGASMGGFQSLMWSVSYPDFSDFVINLVTGPAVLGRNLAIFKLINNIIEDDPSYKHGNYSENPECAVKNINELFFLFAFTIPHYHHIFPKQEMLFQALKDQGAEGIKELDARDVVWRNNAAINFDIRNQLEKIRARTLIIGIEGDQYFPPEIEAIPLSKSIKNSKLFVYKSDLGHLGINEIEKMKNAMVDFLNE